MQQHVTVFLRDGKRDLTFKVKVILPANFHSGRPAMLGLGKCRRRIPLFHHMGWCDKKLLFKRFIHRQNRRQFFVFDIRQFGGGTRLRAGFGRHTKHRLTIKLHQSVGQNRLIMGMGRGHVINTGHIIGGQNAHHTGC